MNLLVYIIVFPIVWLLSILPFRILYIISDFFYLIVFYITGYRKKIVYDNLKLVFPEKNHSELLKIRRKFYRHFVDIFIEMIKSFTISKKTLHKHFSYTNLDLIHELLKNGKSMIIMPPHYANWEWTLGIGDLIKSNNYGAYKNISNKYFNYKILKSRQRFGVSLFRTNKISALFAENANAKKQCVYGLVSDQTPRLKEKNYWNYFLGVKAPIIVGAEILAKKYDITVVFLETKKIKRGYYESTFKLITDNPKKHPNFEIMDTYCKMVEEVIREKPEYYLWSHKRFKHIDKAPKE